MIYACYKEFTQLRQWAAGTGWITAQVGPHRVMWAHLMWISQIVSHSKNSMVGFLSTNPGDIVGHLVCCKQGAPQDILLCICGIGVRDVIVSQFSNRVGDGQWSQRSQGL